MGYLNKADILSAYKVLSTISPDPSLQGATQKVSAIRYFIALDMFCRKKGNGECSTRDKSDKELFENYVGQMCSVGKNVYTANFYYPLKSHNGDYNVGSNFFSAGQVKASLINPTSLFDYPKRGNAPLLRIRNGILIKDLDLYRNLNSYVETDKAKAALVIWMVRNIALVSEGSAFTCLKNTLKQMISPEMIELLMPDTTYYHQEIKKLFREPLIASPSQITNEDIAEIFSVTVLQNSVNRSALSRQIIHYGAPGTGKSHKIKEYLDKNDVSKENIFRTTFHPNSDYATFVGAYKPIMTKQYRYNDSGIKITYKEDDDLAQAKKSAPIVDRTIEYGYVPQAFLNAYVRAYQTEEDVFLIIEEINRGNCAQIFGDLFQLLDRGSDGNSSYTIKAGTDIKTYLEEKLGCENEGIKNGELCLPNNLHILATMNTSDQSLFPIDSAFKRRWDWKYIKISNGYEKGDDGEYLKDAEGNKIPLGWEIDIKDKDGNNYDWWQFLQKINSIINYMTASADKQLGYFFCKAIDKKISADVFVNKVLFYLWNDVFKDYAIDEGSLFTYKKDGSEDPIDITFPNFYDEDGNVDTSTVSEFIENVMAWSNEDVE